MNKNYENGIIKTLPQKWTKEKESEILDLKSKGYSSAQIGELVGRSQISIAIKLKRLTKTGDTYNKKHRDDKYAYNKLFLERINPKSILDVYAGNSFYTGHKKLTTNDKDTKFTCDYHKDAFDLLCHLRNKKYDIVDLDPYGSAIDVFPLALRLAKKGIIITLGEMGHKRWKRLDFVRKWYGIDSLENFTSEIIIQELQRIGLCYKKKLNVIYKRDYNNITRVWFEITPFKTTEQWKRN